MQIPGTLTLSPGPFPWPQPSLCFVGQSAKVPAGVGVVAHLDAFTQYGIGLAVALVASTILAILAGVGAFVLVARMAGVGDE